MFFSRKVRDVLVFVPLHVFVVYRNILALLIVNYSRVYKARPTGPILSVFFALIVQSELKSVHPGFPVAFIF